MDVDAIFWGHRDVTGKITTTVWIVLKYVRYLK